MTGGPRLLAVHGTGGRARTDRELAVEWAPALADGLAAAGAIPPGATLPGDLAVVDATAGGPPLPPGDPARLVGLVGRWLRVTPLFDDAGRPRPATGRRPADLGGSRFFTGLEEADVHALARLVDAHRHDPAVRRAAADRVLARLGPSVRVVVAHSVGAYGAYAALDRVADGVPRTLVTIGAPAGVGPPRPGWVSVADPRDRLAGPAGVPVACQPRLRAVRPYLAHPEVGRVLAAALAAAGAG